MDEVFQFKCLTDLKEYINKYDFKARPTKPGQHPMLYRSDDQDVNENIMGIRLRDYEFSHDLQWIIPNDQKGLSFAGTWYRLSRTYKMFNRGNVKSPDVYWVLSGADLPSGLKFEADRSPRSSAKGHFFLTVTEKMTVETLRKKLLRLSDRMSKIVAGGKVL